MEEAENTDDVGEDGAESGRLNERVKGVLAGGVACPGDRGVEWYDPSSKGVLEAVTE